MSTAGDSSVGAWLAAQSDLDRLDRELLACRALGLSRAALISHPETNLDDARRAGLNQQAARRREGEPMAYILGEREFWGLALEVSPAVLVPRPETETLVQAGLDALAGRRGRRPLGAATEHPVSVLDLGTGSGAVAIALAVEARRRGLAVQVTATDRSAAALNMARHNACRHGVPLRLIEGDWFEPVHGRYHLVLSNPPYVAEDDAHLASLRHEPRAALAAGPDGLADLRRIIEAAPAFLHPGGTLALEHGFDQGQAVRRLLAAGGLAAATTLQDLSGHDRVTRAQRPPADHDA